MGYYIITATSCFVFGCYAVYRFFMSVEKSKFESEVTRLSSLDKDAEFNFFPGIMYDRVSKGRSKEWPYLSAIDKVYISRVDNHLEIYGAYTRAGKIELDPNPLYIPLEDIDVAELAKMGSYLVDFAHSIDPNLIDDFAEGTVCKLRNYNDQDLTEERNNIEAKLVQKVLIICKSLEFLTDDIDDEYNKIRIIERIERAKEYLNDITDEFYKGAATHQMVNILYRAKMFGEAQNLFDKVSDDFLRKKIMEDNPNLDIS
ncbi:hypothetical protein ACFOSD_01575 [Salinispirillum marinum]|uniref:Uncharacterized protein n=2 Tax=Saccharospirillaceae TaxID=255527 RepID=A0ABV8BCL1_9GAMM